MELEACLGLGVALNKLQRSEAIAQYELARAIGKRLPDLDRKRMKRSTIFARSELGPLGPQGRSGAGTENGLWPTFGPIGAGEPLTIQVATTLAYYLRNLKRADEGILITEPNYQLARARAGLPLPWLRTSVSAHATNAPAGQTTGSLVLFEELGRSTNRSTAKAIPETVVTMSNVAFAMVPAVTMPDAAAIIEKSSPFGGARNWNRIRILRFR
ncbi:MAG: hypothetical protein IPK97_10515 [Ahniella sp.]|nr:hypothetical protein [Ahniella sp.]